VQEDDGAPAEGDAKSKKASVADRAVAERPQGQKAAKAERKQQKSKESLDEMNAESLHLRALAQADSVTFNVMSKLGPHHPVAKEWFELKGKVALEKLRQESEQLKLNLKQQRQQQKARSAKTTKLVRCWNQQPAESLRRSLPLTLSSVQPHRLLRRRRLRRPSSSNL
jgi:hypothetical protein